jgi:photosystem II stability/assembly factor-like uncharacterized protein
VKKIFYILLITQLTAGLSYSQSGWFWQNLNPNEELSSVFFINENTGFIGSAGYSSNIYKTTNAGLNWFTTIDSLSSDLWCVYFLNINTGFAAYRGSILKTTNSGDNWSYVYEGNNILFSITFASPDTGYACGKWTTMLKTTNRGDNWSEQTIPVGMYQDLSFINNNTGFTVSERDYITKTTNGGVNWIRKNVGYNSRLYAVTFLNTNTGFCGGEDGESMCAFKTTNGGENWTETLHGYQGIITDMTFVNNQTGYSVGTAIFKTADGGETWQIQMNLGWNELYSVFFVNELTGYTCGGDTNRHGILYKTTTGGEPIGIQPISTEIPTHFVLQQNYPNPFNPNTKIKFSIPPLRGVRGVTKLAIYDILGREVAVLVNEELSPGTYEVEWSATGGADNFASGIYFYQLTTDGFSQTKKMVLIK